jgi:hypothetical protein
MGSRYSSGLTAVAYSSYVSQKIVAPYGIVYHGVVDAVIIFFLIWRTQIEIQFTIEGIKYSWICNWKK